MEFNSKNIRWVIVEPMIANSFANAKHKYNKKDNNKDLTQKPGIFRINSYFTLNYMMNI